MVNVEINADTRYPVDRKVIRKAVVDALFANRTGELNVEVSVAVVGKRKMKNLVDKYLKDDGEHEVLSFPYEDVSNKASVGFVSGEEGILRLGDIVLCWPKVLEAASVDDVMVSEEVRNLVMHSVEHLLGKHHE